MIYNIYIGTTMGAFNLMGLAEKKLSIVIDAYKKGKTEFTISGEKYHINRLQSLQFSRMKLKVTQTKYLKTLNILDLQKKGLVGYHIPPEGLQELGNNVTDKFIGDEEFGQELEENGNDDRNETYIATERIDQLQNIKNPNYDFSRLVKLCEEINDNYQRNNLLSVAMLGRSILNHVPPLFGFDTFSQVANNYGNISFKTSMNHLNNTMRNIANSYLHEKMRMKESIPLKNQVNFSQDLDLLLDEIVRIN